MNEAIDQLAMASSINWYGQLLWTEEGRVLRKATELRINVNEGTEAEKEPVKQ